jgi:hypothetical protein
MYRFFCLPVIVLLVCTFSACEPEEVPDTAAPVITVTSPGGENSRVKGVATISAIAEDVDAEVTMQIFVDGNLIREVVTKEITAEVDTRLFVEGSSHELRIVATDKALNTSEKLLNFEVRNILFILHGSSNYVQENTTIYFMLSKNDGTVMAFKKMENDATITIPTPDDFNPDSTFVVTEYFYLNAPDPVYSIVARATNMYAGLTAGEFYLGEQAAVAAITGTHRAEVTGVTSRSYEAGFYGQQTGSIYGFWGDTNTIIADLSMRSSLSDLIFTYREAEGIPMYKYFSSIAVGQSTLFTLADLVPMQQTSLAVKDASGNYRIQVAGGANPEETYQIYTDEESFSDGKIQICYPAGIFPVFRFDLSYSLGWDNYSNAVIGPTPPTTFQHIDAVVKSTSYGNRKFSSTTTGSFDLLSFSGNLIEYMASGIIIDSYNLSFPSGAKHNVTIPTTPTALADYNFVSSNDFEFSQAGFETYSGFSGDNKYQQILFPSDKKFRSDRESVGHYFPVTPSGSGGRVPQSKRSSLPKNVQETMRNYDAGGRFIW